MRGQGQASDILYGTFARQCFSESSPKNDSLRKLSSMQKRILQSLSGPRNHRQKITAAEIGYAWNDGYDPNHREKEYINYEMKKLADGELIIARHDPTTGAIIDWHLSEQGKSVLSDPKKDN